MPARHLHRVDTEGVYFHIYNKGVENKVIFSDKADFETFISYLEDYLTSPKDPKSTKQTFTVRGRTFHGVPHQSKNYFKKVELVTYCLMPDHFHLVIRQLKKGSVEKFIRSLCTRYSIYFNKKYQRSGSLFAGPYKSTLVETGEHLSHLSRYLHAAGDYTSHPDYLGERSTAWVNPRVVLDHIGTESGGYKQFADSEIDHEILKEQLTLDNKNIHLERRLLTSTPTTSVVIKTHTRLPEFFIASTVVFLLFVSLGVRNIMVTNSRVDVSTAKILGETDTKQVTLTESTPVPATATPSPKASESASKVTHQATPSTKPTTTPTPKVKSKHGKKTVTVVIDDNSSYVNVRKKPSSSSQKVGQAKNGETFEPLSLTEGWYEVKLASGSGYISAKYVKEKK